MISRSLDLPEGYQRYDWYSTGENPNGVFLDQPTTLLAHLTSLPEDEAYLYTHHEVFLHSGIIKHTRSSPNWEGGLVTYSTCKHHLRCTSKPSWVGRWLCGLCPKGCANNCLLYAGRIAMVFLGNYELGRYLGSYHQDAYKAKLATQNPRGDVYTPIRTSLPEGLVRSHTGYIPPEGHTRSVEYYKKSPGSLSDRDDGLIPKWWRDLEYRSRGGAHPPVFVLNPCYLFSKPTLWSSIKPGRASVRTTASKLARSLTAWSPD